MELEQVLQGGIIHYSRNIDSILEEGHLYVERARKSQKSPLVSVLMHGPPGSGKTALAALIAKNSEFPFIKLISPEGMVGFDERSKVNYINKVFEDAYKSPLNVVIVDNVERILEYVPLGPQFSNAVLQTLLILFCKQPPNGRRLLIIATTTQRSLLEQLGLLGCFNEGIAVPGVSSHSELAHILRVLQVFQSPGEQRAALEELHNLTGTTNLDVGIRKILMSVETARQDEDMVKRFVSDMSRSVGQMWGAFDK